MGLCMDLNIDWLHSRVNLQVSRLWRCSIHPLSLTHRHMHTHRHVHTQTCTHTDMHTHRHAHWHSASSPCHALTTQQPQCDWRLHSLQESYSCWMRPAISALLINTQDLISNLWGEKFEKICCLGTTVKKCIPWGRAWRWVIIWTH